MRAVDYWRAFAWAPGNLPMNAELHPDRDGWALSRVAGAPVGPNPGISAAVFGGGFKAGYAHGATDATGEEVVTGALGIPDFNATLALALGLPVDQVVFSPSQRPFLLADKGTPVTALLA